MVKQQQQQQTAIDNSSEQRNSSSSKYKGVRKRKWGKWVSEIRLPNSRERIWLGSYDSPEKAARAFDAALFCLRGRSASFNFPDNPPDIPAARSLSSSEIQAAASRFANTEAVPPPRDSRGDDRSMSESQSLSPSVSEGSGTAFMMDSDFQVTPTDLFSDLLPTFGSGNYATEYGLFPDFDELNGQFVAEPTPAVDYYAEENLDGVMPGQESFLWNF